MAKEKKTSFRGKVVSSSERQKERGGRGYLNTKGVKVLKLPEDERTFTLDILPYRVTNERHLERNDADQVALPGSMWYRSPIKVHRNVGTENESVVCPRTIGKKCPICEYQLKRIKEGADKEEFKLLYPRERSLYAVIPIGHKDFDEVPHVWDMADSLFQETLMEEIKVDPAFEDFFNLYGGKTLSLRLKWKELGKNPYPEVVSINFEDREDYPEDIMEEVPALDDLVKVLSYEEIHSKFFGIENEGNAGTLTDVEEPEDTHSRRKKTIATPEPEPEPAPVRRQSRPAPEPESEPEPAAPVRRTVRGEAKGVTKTSDKCPHGHKFGVDTDMFDECDKCQIWDDCIEEKEKK